MIAKHIPMQLPKKSDFASLMQYIADRQGKTERLGIINITNCAADTLPAVMAEVLATQQLNTRARGDKTYHLIISFRPGEKPDKNTLIAIEQSICAGLGFGEHQRVSAVHYDTDNAHIHIAINKIHPIRLTLHEPYRDYRTLGDLCEKLEIQYHLQPDNHQATQTLSQGRAADMEHHSGIESLTTWIKRECLAELRNAATWSELHQVMADNGLKIHPRGNGFVISTDDGIQVKASTVARDLSKVRLETRLGQFESDGKKRQAKRRYEKRPVDFKTDTTELYAQYQAEQHKLADQRGSEWDRLGRQKNLNVETAKRANRLRRAAIKLMGADRFTKKLLYAQAHSAYKAKLRVIQVNYKRERQRLYNRHKKQAWADWLKQQALQGDQTALQALRARQQSQGLQGNTIQGSGKTKSVSAPTATIDNITKQGTIIYRTEQGAMRDDGQKLQVSHDTTSAVEQALRMAMRRYGPRISVTGSPQFKARVIHAAASRRLPITLTDAGLERRRQLLSEEDHERRTDRRRVDRRGPGYAGRGAARTGRSSDRAAAERYIASGGGEPPTAAKNRLRRLSECDVVRFPRRSQMLLQSNVSGDLEHQRTKPDHQLRRPTRTTRLTPGQAADKYIAERNSKRANGIDIAEHLRYTNKAGAVTYGGARTVEGQTLALLKHAHEVLVLPVDQATARRMKRLRIGEAVTVTPRGSLKKSGRKK